MGGVLLIVMYSQLTFFGQKSSISFFRGFFALYYYTISL